LIPLAAGMLDLQFAPVGGFGLALMSYLVIHTSGAPEELDAFYAGAEPTTNRTWADATAGTTFLLPRPRPFALLSAPLPRSRDFCP
jgi:hypothetical protein